MFYSPGKAVNGLGRTYLCIDQKSFYASVECVERKLDPMTTKLVVADPTRTEATICLAVSPEMKRLGVKNRCRLREIPSGIEYITAMPQMALYLDYSARIYGIFLKYVAKEDIHVYSVDEAFLDITEYMSLRHQTARDFAQMILQDIHDTLGLVATCGIGTNLYLAKIALDILAKHAPDFIAELTEERYREQLWDHRPLTDFWRIAHGTEARLAKIGVQTMREIAHCDEKLLYKIFGIDAELLIDHAWGRETTTIADIHAYKPKSTSLSSGQVLPRGYAYDEGRVIVREMAEELALDMFNKRMAASSISLYLSYSFSSMLPPSKASTKTAPTSSMRRICDTVVDLYDRIRVRNTPMHRVNIAYAVNDELCQQYDLFTSPEKQDKERQLQRAIIDIRQKHGKNSVLRAMDLLDGARTIERHNQIGGHRA